MSATPPAASPAESGTGTGTGTDSVVDYAALPGPGGHRSLIPPVDSPRWTLKVAFGQRPWSLIASLGMAVSFVCNGLTPVIVGRAVDGAIATSSLSGLGLWILVLAGVIAVAICANWTARFMLIRSQQVVSHDLRMLVTDRIQDPRGFAGRDRTAGGLLSVASSDTTRVGEVVMMTVFPVAEAAAIVYGAAMMFTINPWLSLATLVGGPVLVVIALWVARPLQRRSVARQQAVAEAAATAADVVQGLRILKGLGAVVTVRRRYDEVSGRAYRRTVHANAAQARLNGTTEAAGATFVATLGLAAGALALDGRISVGELITAVGLTQFLVTPMTMFGRNLASRWASAEASGRRIRDVVGAGFERVADADAALADRFIGSLPAGLTAVSGADDELTAALESLPRTRVIVAPHASDLFDGTVADNAHPGRARAEEALRDACCDDIPGGPDKRVGENGRMLSGGQRQRVALARALAADPEVLVLLDPTTAVDSVTEQNLAANVTRRRGEAVTLVFSESPAWRAVAATHLSAGELAGMLDEAGAGPGAATDVGPDAGADR